MKNIFFTPGPSQLYPTSKRHLQQALREDIPSISHRSKKFQDIYDHTVSGLKKLLSIPDTHHIFFLSSGTEAMERVIENCVDKYSYHLVNGAFSKRFYKTAVELGKNAQKYEVPAGEGFKFSPSPHPSPSGRGTKGEGIIIPNNAELVCITQNETSTGVQVPMRDVYFLNRKYPAKLIALDIVSSAPYVDIDYKKVDLVFFSVQKGFGLPAGLAVIILSPKAFKKAQQLQEKGVIIGSYHSFISLEQYALKNQTPETPNVLNIYLLGKVIGDMREIGIEKIRKETEQKARLLYEFFDNVSRHPELVSGSKKKRSRNKFGMTMRPFVKNKKWRSQTVIVIEIEGGSKSLIEKLKAKGLVVGSGYGELKERQIRIANFPAVTKEDIELLLK